MMDEQGLLTIYSIENTAANGLKPNYQLVTLGTAYYEERQVGVTRLYAARSANAQIDGLVRVFNTDLAQRERVVTLNDDNQYQIDAAQKVIGKDAWDITLVRIEELYEIYTEPTE